MRVRCAPHSIAAFGSAAADLDLPETCSWDFKGGSLPHPMMHSSCFDDLASEWFAVQVRAGREHHSASHLLQRGYEVFLPCYRQYRRWSDRVKSIERALFDGYLFCRLHQDIVGKIVTASGVIRIVGDGHRPLPIPAADIEALQRIVETQLDAEPWTYLQVGQRVRIEMGPLRGVEGIVLRAKNRHRLVVSVAVLQRSVSVELDPEWISTCAEN